jgi:hypothetical protein
MLQDFSFPADVEVGGDMPVMSMVVKTCMYIRSLKGKLNRFSPTFWDTGKAHASFNVDIW